MASLIERDLKHIWHPASQMKDFINTPPLVVNRAEGSYLYTDQGEIIDGISSWWCKSLGHRHPKIISALKEQLDCFEHVISASTTHKSMVELGEVLAGITSKQYSFFASDGSSAVEIALKLCMHAQQLNTHSERKEFLALKNAYHGETLGTMAVSDLGLYKKPYESQTLICHFIQNLPYLNSVKDPLWVNAEQHWSSVVERLEKIKHKLCALIVEPLVQGSGGMQIYSADFLKRLATWAKKNSIYLIVDEIMTGMGRTGKWLASEHAEIEADIVCLSKGLTAGTIPFSAVLIDKKIYELFYDDYEKGKSFLHSHTHSGNSLGVKAALATIEVLKQEDLLQRASLLGKYMFDSMTTIAEETQKLSSVRSLGAFVAADFIETPDLRMAYKFCQEALKRGALLRPLGNTIYWLPPLNIDFTTVDKLAEITLNSLYSL